MYTVDNDNRQAWLDSLRPGDEVAILLHSLSSKWYDIYTIASITPNRNKFTLKGSTITLDSTGYTKKSTKWSRPPGVYPVTEGVLLHNRRHRALETVRSTMKYDDWSSFSLEHLEQVVAVIKSHKDSK